MQNEFQPALSGLQLKARTRHLQCARVVAEKQVGTVSPRCLTHVPPQRLSPVLAFVRFWNVQPFGNVYLVQLCVKLNRYPNRYSHFATALVFRRAGR